MGSGRNQYKGGFVLKPKAGIYKDVIVLDFRSLYPSIIVSHNIDASTMKEKKPSEPAVKVPGFNRWFLQKPIGKVPEKIKKILKERENLKSLIKTVKDKRKLEKLKKKEHSLKLAANIQYGMFGYPMGPNYNVKVAESISAFGRYYIQNVISRAKKFGFNVIYGDTDSVFIQGSERKAKLFLKNINKILPGIIKLEYRGKYKRALFTNAKKRYALLGRKVEIKGFESERGDWCPLAREIQQKILELILKDGNHERALNYLKRALKNIDKNPLHKFVISKQLSKPLSKYKVKTAHVEVARKLKSRGLKIHTYDIIKFVIIKRGMSYSSKAVSPEDAKKSDLDFNYYKNKQIIPAALRVLEIFKIRKSDLT